MSLLAGVTTEVPLHEVALPFEPFVFGLIALAIFATLCLVLWSYRDVANRHTHQAAPDAAAHAGAPGANHHGAGHGHEESGAGH
jgi:hypothetical protein